MAVTLKLRQALVVDGEVLVGDKNVDQAITLAAGQAFTVRDRIIADDYTADVLWTAGEGGMDAYTHGFIYSDQDIVVEIKTDNGTAEYVLMKVKANVLTALPAICGGNTTESLDGLVLVDGTDFDDAARIEVQRDVADAVGDALVSLWLFS